MNPMKPPDQDDAASAATTEGAAGATGEQALPVPGAPPPAMPAQRNGAAAQHDPVRDPVRDPLRGLADPAPASGSLPGGKPRPSLWTRIKRAFQYGSQGGETN